MQHSVHRLLTIDREMEGSLLLKIPNYSIRTIFWEAETSD